MTGIETWEPKKSKKKEGNEKKRVTPKQTSSRFILRDVLCPSSLSLREDCSCRLSKQTTTLEMSFTWQMHWKIYCQSWPLLSFLPCIWEVCLPDSLSLFLSLSLLLLRCVSLFPSYSLSRISYPESCRSFRPSSSSFLAWSWTPSSVYWSASCLPSHSLSCFSSCTELYSCLYFKLPIIHVRCQKSSVYLCNFPTFAEATFQF